MPTVHRLAERLLYLYFQSKEQNNQLEQLGITHTKFNRLWLLDMAMDAIGYPSHDYDCDDFYKELYMIHPPDSLCFVNKQFSRLYWYQVANAATTAQWKDIYNLLWRDIRILREKLPYYFTNTKRRRTY